MDYLDSKERSQFSNRAGNRQGKCCLALAEDISVVCTEVTTLVNVNLTDFLHQLNDDIRPYIHPPPPPPAPVVPPGMVNFMNNSALEVIDFLLNDIIGSDGPFGINTIFNQLTDNTGIGTFHRFLSS
jgi:hypothetical protein